MDLGLPYWFHLGSYLQANSKRKKACCNLCPGTTCQRLPLYTTWSRLTSWLPMAWIMHSRSTSSFQISVLVSLSKIEARTWWLLGWQYIMRIWDWGVVNSLSRDAQAISLFPVLSHNFVMATTSQLITAFSIFLHEQTLVHFFLSKISLKAIRFRFLKVNFLI